MADTPTPKPEVSVPSEQTGPSKTRKQRYEELRKRMGESKLKVVGKAGRHYLWASTDDMNEMARLDGLGYHVVREPNVDKVLKGTAKAEISANGLRSDGTYRLGDVQLVECDEEVYEFLMLDVEEKHDALVRAAKEDFVVEAEKVGSPTFETAAKR